jgi:hypothetical protein
MKNFTPAHLAPFLAYMVDTGSDVDEAKAAAVDAMVEYRRHEARMTPPFTPEAAGAFQRVIVAILSLRGVVEERARSIRRLQSLMGENELLLKVNFRAEELVAIAANVSNIPSAGERVGQSYVVNHQGLRLTFGVNEFGHLLLCDVRQQMTDAVPEA